MPATQAGFAHVGHPVGQLVSPPCLRRLAAWKEQWRVCECRGDMATTKSDLKYAIVNAAFGLNADGGEKDKDEEKAVEWDAPWLGTLSC